MTSQLVGTSFTNGAVLPNYVNGRLLAAEDLATGQCTLLTRDTLIGQGAGPGVVTGLWVSPGAGSVTVAPGLGLNGNGEPIRLASAVTLPLTGATTTAPGPAGVGFANCTTAPSAPGPGLADGAYLLTALPACQLQGQAALAAPPDSTLPAGCTAQWEVEGVEFKAITLPFGTAVAGITVTAANRRSLLAHWCFGSGNLTQLGVDPFNFDPAYRGFDQLAAADLGAADLPLAVFYWENGAVSFVDNWSARRRPVHPDPLPDPQAHWLAAVSDRRLAEGEARFLQFQEQIDVMADAGTLGGATAVADFGLLPPAGLLPITVGLWERMILAWVERTGLGDVRSGALDEPYAFVGDLPITRQTMLAVAEAAQATQPAPLALVAFFGELALFGGVIHWDRADEVLRRSWHDDAVNPAPVSSTGTLATGTLATPTLASFGGRVAGNFFAGLPPTVALSYYLVYENLEAILKAVRAKQAPTVTPYLVFVNRGIDRAMKNAVADRAVADQAVGTVVLAQGQPGNP